MDRLAEITKAAGASEFHQYLIELLVELCRIDTSPRPDVAAMRRAEDETFSILRRELMAVDLADSVVEFRPIDPAIEAHPFFSRPYYTQTPERPGGLSVGATYAGRGNLYYFAAGAGRHGGGLRVAFNTHIDVVAPFFPPQVAGQKVVGRGACDDKGCIVSLLGGLRLLAGFLRRRGLRLNRDLVAMFVIDEEMGGNGSLSAALDAELSGRYDSLMVLECCDQRVHPANRGAVWYRLEGKAVGADLFEASAFIVKALEEEGRALRAESDHPLFPHRPVQTCHGIIGNWGEHPSRVSGEVWFDIAFAGGRPGRAGEFIGRAIAVGLAEYCGQYGDKCREGRRAGGQPGLLSSHCRLERAESGFVVRVFGLAGHMAAGEESDCAITKMAAMVRALVRDRPAIERAAGGPMRLSLHGWDRPGELVMEGGQGFLPTHEMEEVQGRIRRSALRGLEEYCRSVGVAMRAGDVLRVSFEKLHNAAYASDPSSPAMRHAVEAARAAGTWRGEPVRGWDASCDARIFAHLRPGLPVLTAGPGKIRFAHSDCEQMTAAEMAKAAEFLAHFILRQTGTWPAG